MDIPIKIGQQDVLPEFLQGCSCVPRQPIGYDLLFRLHIGEGRILVDEIQSGVEIGSKVSKVTPSP